MKLSLAGLSGLGDCLIYDADGVTCLLEGTTVNPGDPILPGTYAGGYTDPLASLPSGTTVSSTGVITLPNGQTPTAAQQQAGLTALAQLTSAALSNIAKLPGQSGLQPGQSLTMGPGGTYQITAAGVAPGASLGLGTSLGSLLPLLLVGGLVVFAMSRR